jgi:antitoxin HicB
MAVLFRMAPNICANLLRGVTWLVLIVYVRPLQANYGSQEHIVAENFSFSVVLEPQEGGGFTVLVPALPEVVTEGDTEQDALANAEEAIRAVIEYRRDNGLLIPSDAHPEVRRVTVAA